MATTALFVLRFKTVQLWLVFACLTFWLLPTVRLPCLMQTQLIFNMESPKPIVLLAIVHLCIIKLLLAHLFRTFGRSKGWHLFVCRFTWMNALRVDFEFEVIYLSLSDYSEVFLSYGQEESTFDLWLCWYFRPLTDYLFQLLDRLLKFVVLAHKLGLPVH